jgi:hypothetical protein
MSFIDTSVQIDGVTHWPFPALPVEVADSPSTRTAGAAVQIFNAAGTAAVTVRMAGTLTATNVIQSSPAFGESPGVFGSVPAFYAPAGTVVYRTAIMDHVVTSPAYINLVGAINATAASAEQAATSAATSATAAQSVSGQVQSALTQAQQASATATATAAQVQAIIDAGGLPSGGTGASVVVVQTEAQALAQPVGTLVAVVP